MEKIDATTTLAALSVAYNSHEGMVGKNNEDALGFFAWQGADGHPLYLAVVADGVGGQTAGELASQLTVETVERYFDEQDAVDEQTILGHLAEAIHLANQAVFARAQDDKAVQGMATTIVVTAVFNGRLYTSHVGDSRIYLWRESDLAQITHDHSWVQEAVDAGLLTAEQAKRHPHRNIIRRSLGSLPEAEVDQQPVSTKQRIVKQGMPLQSDDMLLLCSDGLTDMIDDEAVKETLGRYEQGEIDSLEAAVTDLIDKANQAGGHDNITVILLHIPDQPLAETHLEHYERQGPLVVSAPVPLAKNNRWRGLWLQLIIALTILTVLLVLLLQRGGL